MLLSASDPLIISFCVSLLILLSCYKGTAQLAARGDTILQPARAVPDSIYSEGSKLPDTSFSNLKQQAFLQKYRLTQALKSAKDQIIVNPFHRKLPNKDTLVNRMLSNPHNNLIQLSKPLFHFHGGYLAYNFNYHSNTDTPYAEKNIAQHMINGMVNFSVAQSFPFVANFWIRRSNSRFYRDITDVQVQFNAPAFKNQLVQELRERLSLVSNDLKDSTLEKLYFYKNKKLSELQSWFQDPFTFQKVVQANETIKLPEKNYDARLSDSANKQHSDSLQVLARWYMEEYEKQKALYEKTKKEADSLEMLYASMKSKIARCQSLIKNGVNTASLAELQQQLNGFGVNTPPPSPALKWLLGVRNFSLGKSPVNYSELTAKNISLNGINLEYNSWYYLAVTAGLVDYRFNEVVTGRQHQPPSYMYMIRVGLGSIENNHFIVSLYQGRKQLYASSQNASSAITVPVTGLSAEARWNINSNTYAVVEVAQSISPDYHYNPAQKATFSFFDNSNKALSLKVYSFFPLTNSRLEGMYKNTGSNFQSFNSFQTTAALKSWYVKGEQTLLKRKLKLTGSVRNNDFSNPYILQNYKSNTIFTSLNATFRVRKLPVVTFGYMPMSQFTMLGDQVVENRFQTLMANISHYYRVGIIQATSFASFNKFFNSATDTGFVFYNAANILLGQSFYFSDFTASINFSRSVSPHYELNVASEDISFNISKRGSAGLGLKLNSYNNKEVKIGQFVNFNYQVGKMDYIVLNYEQGYLPGTSGGDLRLNNFGNVQFIKRFQ